ncbi:hypothetical protein [Roseibium sp.]|uniref:hypothetical protein n=1 Tax=Roseibium sp. TaxID=1936156 RepID=UPI003A9824B1
MVGGRSDVSRSETQPGGHASWVFIPWFISLVVLEALPVFGVECLFSWCGVQFGEWKVIALVVSFTVLACTGALEWALDRFR